MQKIMFMDKFGLTRAVTEGRKTMTRRIIKAPRTMEGKDVYGFSVIKDPLNKAVIEVMALDADGAQINNIMPRYKVGEVVAVAQRYRDIMDYLADSFIQPAPGYLTDNPGYNNKMFVRADLMPHQIRFTNVRAERLQDITEEDCLKEGVDKGYLGYYINGLKTKDWKKESHVEKDGKTYRLFPTPRKAFAALIDMIHGKGTWDSNPWVYAYEHELVK